jgi:hypothetical protein
VCFLVHLRDFLGVSLLWCVWVDHLAKIYGEVFTLITASGASCLVRAAVTGEGFAKSS